MAQGQNTLFYTVKELQNEKVCLEQKLQELDLKRRNLEQSLEQETGRCDHMAEKHRRMAGTFAVAQQKVEMTMTSCTSLQEYIDKRKPELERIQAEIEMGRKEQRENIKTFETTLSGLSAELFHARDFYKKTALKNEINRTKKEHTDLEKKIAQDLREEERLHSRLEQLMKQRNGCPSSNYGCEAALYACYSALERDRQEAEEYRDRVQAELAEIPHVLNV